MTRSKPFCWQGRQDDGDESRWHQKVNNTEPSTTSNQGVKLIGFCSDEGVRRNKGRIGAALGPDSIRQALTNLVYPCMDAVEDMGDIFCQDGNLEFAQASLAKKLKPSLENKDTVVVIGGGHEMAFASYQGIRSVYPDQQLGIINFDAHFDLRPYRDLGSSGTPFRQAANWADAHAVNFNYLVLGINESVNTPLLFEYARLKKVDWLSDIEMNSQAFSTIINLIDNYCRKFEIIYLSICLDVFPHAYAPGVSAPAALGINPNLIIRLIQHIRKNFKQKLVLLDIAEMNPQYDNEGQTARLAARLINEYLGH